MFKIKKYIICSFLVITLTLLAITLITFYCHTDMDVSSVKTESIDMIEVFCHNFATTITSTLIGILTGGIYTLVILIINIMGIGMLSNALYINNMTYLIPKLMPHGIIELFSLSVCVIYAFFTFVYIIRNIKKIFLGKYSISFFAKKIFLSLTLIMLVNIILLGIASVVEYII